MKEERKVMKKRIKLMNKHFKKPFKKKFNEDALGVINADLENAEKRAIEILSIDNVKLSEPIVIVQANSDFDDLKYRLIKKGEETILNYNYSSVLTFLFGETSLFYHEADVNHVSGKLSNDFTGEINFKDIVNVETYFNNEKVGKTDISNLELILGLVNGDSLNLSLRKHYYFNDEKEITLLNNDEKYVIDQIRTAIRTVK